MAEPNRNGQAKFTLDLRCKLSHGLRRHRSEQPLRAGEVEKRFIQR